MTFIEKMMSTLENDEAMFSTQIETTAGTREDYVSPGNFPLEKLQFMLEDWDQEDLYTKDELMDYAHELWKTADQFEQELKNSLNVHEQEMKMVKFSSAMRTEWIKHKTSMYITTLEEALRYVIIICVKFAVVKAI